MSAEEPQPLGLLGTVSPSLKDYHLIEQFIVVGLPHNYHVESHFHNEQQTHEPQVIYKYPPDKPLVNPMIPDFCFQDELTTTSTQRMVSGSTINSLLFSPLGQLHDMEHSFVFLITEASAVFYGICILKWEPIDQISSFFNMPSFLSPSHSTAPPDPTRSMLSMARQHYDVSAPRAYCFISRFPFIQLHFHVLFSIIERERLLLLACYSNDKTYARDVQSNLATSIVEYYYNYKKVDPGPYISLLLPSIPGDQKQERFYCPADDARLLAGWGLFYVFDKVAVEDILLMFSFIMQEQSVLVVCKQPGVLSAVIITLVSLLKPFYWQCAIVPILPKKLMSAIDSPVPFFMGSCILPPVDTLWQHDFLLVDLDQHNIIKPSRAVPPLPGYQKLYDTISFHKQQFHNLQQAPLQHRKYKFIEDILNTFRDYETWITEEISYAILSASTSTSSAGPSSSSFSVAPAIQFLDSKENNASILQHFSSTDREFFTNFMHTQMFSVHASDLFHDMETKLISSTICLQKLKDLILMEEKSRDVLKHYSKTGVHDKQRVAMALKETESVLAMLKESKKQLEGEVVGMGASAGLGGAQPWLFSKQTAKPALFSTPLVAHRRAKSLTSKIDQQILSRTIATTSANSLLSISATPIFPPNSTSAKPTTPSFDDTTTSVSTTTSPPATPPSTTDPTTSPAPASPSSRRKRSTTKE
eukprot:Phypoly_transcript_03361.p1 GENE.Phypoly_transcript_03361~~Phypoly_transcript_03361.p1  ORF type:complete len:700 (+),score=107.38 Phypoly_transcript_03361:131-2230(+)